MKIAEISKNCVKNENGYPYKIEKNENPYIFYFTFFFLGGDDDTTTTGMEVEFDNIAIVNGIEQQLSLVTAEVPAMAIPNSLGQKFNINLLRYYISAIELETTDGKVYKDVLEVTATGSKGYYLIDEANPASQVVELDNIPAGKYSKITFTVGVDSTGVLSMGCYRWRNLDQLPTRCSGTGIQATSPSNLVSLMLPTVVWWCRNRHYYQSKMASLTTWEVGKHCRYSLV